MHLDAKILRHFYYRTQLGRRVQKTLRDTLVEKWDHHKGQTIVGFGFAVPLLRPFLKRSQRVIGLMPGPQGVMAWPAGESNLSVLCNESLWPLQTGTIDKLVIMHGLETSDDSSALLTEAWRCLSPSGSVVFIIPNRAGLWSRSDATPFGYGHPYSLSQLEKQLTDHHFALCHSMSSLYHPPSNDPFWRRFSRLCETIGHKLPFFNAGGVLIVEAMKQAPAPPKSRLGQHVRRPLNILQGLSSGHVEPAHKDISRAKHR